MSRLQLNDVCEHPLDVEAECGTDVRVPPILSCPTDWTRASMTYVRPVVMIRSKQRRCGWKCLEIHGDARHK